MALIPDRIVEAIHGPAVMYIGTRDERLRPAQTFVIGAVVHPDRETVTFFIPESRSARILSDLTNNGRVALAVSLVSHEAYQLKGSFIASRPANAQERAVQEIYRSKLLSAMLQAGYPEQIAKPLVLGFAYQPAVAITVRAEEIFLQTPGPEAGKKLS
ncbi:MAG: pyridoxamine 5'-phosphate oxidase family protein [Candidatus Binatia bacterium]